MVKPVRKRSRAKFATKALILCLVMAAVGIASTFYTQTDELLGETISSLVAYTTTEVESDSNKNAEQEAPKQEVPKQELPRQETPKQEASKAEESKKIDVTENVKINDDKNALIKERRKAMTEKCSETSDIDVLKKEYFTSLPGASEDLPKQAPKPSLKRCKNIVLDFGANVGDTAGHLIDAGLPTCNGDSTSDSYPRLMLGDRDLQSGKWNMVTKFLKQMMDANKMFPEDYCYYGIEGNPVFTKRLQGIEDYIGAINPSPLAHVSFLTESVGAGTYGMTKLYLDTVNTKENFWGSSIMQGHQDVKKSMAEGEMEEPPSHDVMGYTITKLMEMTLVGLKEGATEEDKKGAHLLLKVDIEGGEYALTQEVVESNALCNFVKMGNTVDVVIETHSQRVTGPNPLAHQYGGWKSSLQECGVTFRGLQAWWA